MLEKELDDALSMIHQCVSGGIQNNDLIMQHFLRENDFTPQQIQEVFGMRLLSEKPKRAAIAQLAGQTRGLLFFKNSLTCQGFV